MKRGNGVESIGAFLLPDSPSHRLPVSFPYCVCPQKGHFRAFLGRGRRQLKQVASFRTSLAAILWRISWISLSFRELNRSRLRGTNRSVLER